MTFFRPINGLCAAYGVFVVAMLTGYIAGVEVDMRRILLGTLITFLYTNAIIGHHDFYDKADRKTHAWRALHRGAINPNAGRVAVILLLTISIISSWFLGFYAFLIIVIVTTVGIWYNRWAKYRPCGLFVVSICTVSVVPFGSVLAIPNQPWILIPFYIGLVCSEICREAGNYCQDYKGDAMGGSKTLPVVIGRKRTMIIGLIFLIVAIPPFLSHYFGWLGAVLITNGTYLIGGSGYIVLLAMAWMNSYIHLDMKNEKHITKVFEFNFRYAGRFYLLLILQPLMLCEIFI